jgi:hypothetical protein
MVNLKSMKLPLPYGNLVMDGDGFHFENVNTVDLSYKELEEVAIVINHALNMVDDYDGTDKPF